MPSAPVTVIGRLFPKLFFGWVVVAGTSMLSFVVVGVGFYCLTVLFDALCREHGWASTQVALATSLFFVCTGLFGSIVGRGIDRFGPRMFVAPGALVMALALIWIGRLQEPWQLYVAYPMLALGFSMAGAVPNNALITRWFVSQRARAMSISHTGVSVGGMVLVPVTTAGVIQFGVADTTAALALLVVVVVLLSVLFFLRTSPESMGLEPDGGQAPQPGIRLDPSVQRRIWTSRQALATRAFWIAAIAFSGVLICQVGVAMHQLAMLRERMDPGVAAWAVSTTALGSAVARLVVGRFADRLSKHRIATVLIAVQAASLATFALAWQPWMLFAASLVFGFTIGNIFMLQSLVVGELFGMASFGTVFGMLQLVTQVASGAGPYLLSVLVEGLGGYRAGILPLVVLALLSAAVLSRLRPPPAAAATALEQNRQLA